MPVVGVPRDVLFQKLEKTYTQETFQKLCFEFGIELDEETSEKERVRREQGEEAAKGLSDEAIYKIEIPANRYDLLCTEGIAQSLRIFMGKDKKAPSYQIVAPPKPERLIVDTSTKGVRPFCVAAVLRDITFDTVNFASFIELQEKLHQNICRERSLVAIGTHNLDAVHGPFRYEAKQPRDIKFVPLKETREFSAEELVNYYENEKEQAPLKKYVPLLRQHATYPVITDSKGRVLSLPPLVNGEHSRITTETKNVLIECTATDRTKAHTVLNMMVSMFSQYCANKYTVEPVEVSYEGSNEKMLTPQLESRVFTTSIDYLTKGIGIKVDAQRAVQLLRRMQLECQKKGDKLIVTVPPTRSDIIHPCDIMEDLAIAYGYNNIKKTLPRSTTIGKEQSLNKLSDLMRRSAAESSFIEVLNWALTSMRDNYERMGLKDDKKAVLLGGIRKTNEFEIVRTSLLPGILKTCAHNQAMQLPIRLFEVSDVCIYDPLRPAGASNERRFAALYCSKTSGLEVIHGLLDRMFQLFSSKPSLAASNHPYLFKDMQSDIVLNGKSIGTMGVVHPEVLGRFKINAPCSMIEFSIQNL